MRHKCRSKRFSRFSSHRKLMFYNLSKELIKHEAIKTTLTKAKELRRFVEPLITRAKIDTLANRRNILKKIKDKQIVNKLFYSLGKRYIKRCGGYLRILKYKYRHGDGAVLAFVELVDREVN